jgi:hypothetical protein
MWSFEIYAVESTNSRLTPNEFFGIRQQVDLKGDIDIKRCHVSTAFWKQGKLMIRTECSIGMDSGHIIG